MDGVFSICLHLSSSNPSASPRPRQVPGATFAFPRPREVLEKWSGSRPVSRRRLIPEASASAWSSFAFPRPRGRPTFPSARTPTSSFASPSFSCPARLAFDVQTGCNLRSAPSALRRADSPTFRRQAHDRPMIPQGWRGSVQKWTFCVRPPPARRRPAAGLAPFGILKA